MSKFSWDIHYLTLALVYAQASKDPSTKVGCVIVNPDNQPIGWGTNGFAAGYEKDDLMGEREEKYKRILHAEENAILNATDSLKGATAYLTHPPCIKCCHMLKQKGIQSVVTVKPTGEFKDRWCLNETKAELGDLGINLHLLDLVPFAFESLSHNYETINSKRTPYD